MSEIVSVALPVPFRANSSDNPAETVRFAVDALRCGPAVLATLVDVRGGSARSIGSHVAVASDGRYCGYVSGGCVEAAVASEALQAMEEGQDRLVAYGEGSPFFDIVLPCGGGITVAIHVLRNGKVLEEILSALVARRSAALSYNARSETLERNDAVSSRSGWRGEHFISVYRPETQLVVSGQSAEADAVCRVAKAAGFGVQFLSTSKIPTTVEIDPFTAVVLLHHDLDLEADVLNYALQSPAFYIGALGSTRTHHRRIERLRSGGIPSEGFDRIRAPIGLFGPTRDSTSLALSVLAEIAATRLQEFP